MQYDKSSCASCGEIIHHPICPQCLAIEIEQWIDEKRGINGLKREMNKARLNLSEPTTSGGIRCVTGNHLKAFICPYCFTDEVYTKLKQRKASKELLADFLERFNFDFNHEGYPRRIEEHATFLEI